MRNIIEEAIMVSPLREQTFQLIDGFSQTCVVIHFQRLKLDLLSPVTMKPFNSFSYLLLSSQPALLSPMLDLNSRKLCIVKPGGDASIDNASTLISAFSRDEKHRKSRFFE